MSPPLSQNDFIMTKRSSLMSPLRESDLKNSQEGSSQHKSSIKLRVHGTPVSEYIYSDLPNSSSMKRVGLTLDELQRSGSPLRDLSSGTGKFPEKDRTSPMFGSDPSMSIRESWLEDGGFGYMPISNNRGMIMSLDGAQEFKLGETIMSNITLSGRSSQGGFQIYRAADAAINSGLNQRTFYVADGVLKVGVSGPAIQLTKYCALYSLVTPIEVLPLSKFVVGKNPSI